MPPDSLPQKYILALNHTRASQSDYKSLADGTTQASVSASWYPDGAMNISKQRGEALLQRAGIYYSPYLYYAY